MILKNNFLVVQNELDEMGFHTFKKKFLKRWFSRIISLLVKMN